MRIPPRIERQRAQLQDAMVDCQFQFGGARVGIAADPDLLSAIARFFVSMGADVVAAVASARADRLTELPIDSVVIGDLEDLEWLSREHGAELIVANSHGAEIAKRLNTALLRAGFPDLRQLWRAHARLRGLRRNAPTLFDIANLLANQYREIKPYRSRYWQGTERDAETRRDIAC